MYADEVNRVAREKLRVQRLVKILGKYDVVTRQGLMAELGLKKEGIRNFRVKYWYPSRDAGYVMMVYAGAPTCPVQAYKLTEKGREYLAGLQKQEAEQNAESKRTKLGVDAVVE